MKYKMFKNYTLIFPTYLLVLINGNPEIRVTLNSPWQTKQFISFAANLRYLYYLLAKYSTE